MRLKTLSKIGLLVLVILMGCSRAARVGRKVSHQFNANTIFQEAFSGLVVKDATTGKTLVDINGDKYFTPASNTKMVTLMTALAYLPDTLPSLAYKIHGDSLLFWGVGNPAFLDNRLAWDSVTYRFLSENAHHLYFCTNNFQTTSLGSGWAWDDQQYRFSAHRTPMPIYKNSVRVEYDSIHQKVMVTPPFLAKNVAFKIQKGRIHYSKDKNAIALWGNSPAHYEREIPFDYSHQLFAQILGDTLHRQVTVLGGCPQPDEASPLRTIIADSVYAIMMQQSDNLMAEQLLLMSAYAKNGVMREDSILALVKRSLLAPIGVDNPRWVDGSGLSRYNLFRPRDMVAILNYLLETQPKSRLETIFPQGEVKGTIKAWYPSYVFAKTGTMSGIHSLSGFMTTKSGRQVIFSFMHNNYRGSSKKYKPEMSKMLTYIWEKY